MIESNENHGWNHFYTRRESSSYPAFPNEVMLKVLFGQYLADPLKLPAKGVVLDVGCGSGNNLLPFLRGGWQGIGLELSEQILEVTGSLIKESGFEAELLIGHNRNIRLDPASVDLLLSVNSLHYEGTEERVMEALETFRRILKPGGALYLSTVGPEHDIQRRARRLSENEYEVKNFDFRDGSHHYYFNTEDGLKNMLQRFFANVEVGHVTERLMRMDLDFLIAVAR